MAVLHLSDIPNQTAMQLKISTPEKPDKRQTLLEMAEDMDVAMCRRYGEADAAKILGIPEKELAELRELGHIAYLQIGKSHVGFLGQQLLAYLYDCIVPVGETPQFQPETSKPKETISPDAELLSINDAKKILRIGHTKIYELLNTEELESVKIGTRRMVKRASLNRFIGS